jgi:hypothetical protein
VRDKTGLLYNLPAAIMFFLFMFVLFVVIQLVQHPKFIQHSDFELPYDAGGDHD